MRIALLAALFAILPACAHSYHYVPEISGPGASWYLRGVMYRIPAHRAGIRMKLVYLGVKRKRLGSDLKPEPLIWIAMHFESTPVPGGQARAWVDIRDQKLMLSDTSEIPALPEKVSRIELKPMRREYVNLFFPIPQGRPDTAIQWFFLRWKVHYGKSKAVQQITRFDREGGPAWKYHGPDPTSGPADAPGEAPWSKPDDYAPIYGCQWNNC